MFNAHIDLRIQLGKISCSVIKATVFGHEVSHTVFHWSREDNRQLFMTTLNSPWLSS